MASVILVDKPGSSAVPNPLIEIITEISPWIYVIRKSHDDVPEHGLICRSVEHTQRTLCWKHIPNERAVSKQHVAGLRITGMVAPMALDGQINGDWFEDYAAQVLLPELRPGYVVVMDNLSSHQRASVQVLNEPVGATLRFLPPYRPDCNLIEKAFSRLKAMLRKRANGPSLACGPNRQPRRSFQAGRVRQLLQFSTIQTRMNWNRSYASSMTASLGGEKFA